MRILGIETSGSTFSIALWENSSLVSEVYWHSALKHSEKLVPAINSLLADAEWEPKSIDKIAVSIGPGSFTGIRVGLTCARTMAHVLNIPLIGINTLDVLKAGVPQGSYLAVPVIDALRREVYIQEKRNHNTEIKPIEAVLKELRKTKNKILFIGSGALVYQEEITRVLKNKIISVPEPLHFPRAGILVSLAQDKKGKKYDKVKPLYIRRSWAEERQRVSW